MGRGRWHGDDEVLVNDVVVSENDLFVSRRAALLRRAGSGLEVEAHDQGDSLSVVSGGKSIRPSRVRRGAVPVHPGDVIQFYDGREKAIKVRVHRRLPVAGQGP
jgi:hypothetical protein